MSFVLSWYVLDYRLLNGLNAVFIVQNGPREGMEVGFFFVPFFILRYCANMYAYAFSFCLVIFFSLLFPFQESKDSSKPITADDVRQVFENLAKKRRRIE